EILSRLPIRECVATCVLSRSWRNRWKDLQILNFSTKGILLQKDHRRFIDFLKWFLLQQHGAIVPKLRIHYYAAYELGFDEAALKALISAAIGYHLEELKLDLSSSPIRKFMFIQLLRRTRAFGIS
ncbi:MAG: hypothetical protein Q8777_02655, partial [Candidatus Phytoplasma stylosanthis]|uniref:F-box protein n=1 Tax=Candidatus Phytoplasma stylosanthis TaxID=2798314 RepID=UPI00293B6301